MSWARGTPAPRGRARAVRTLGAATLSVGACAAVALCAGQQTPVFRAATEHVSLDVVVTDNHDHPVTDLTAADFRVTENGQPQTISDFQLVVVPTTHRQVANARATEPTIDVATNERPAGGRQWVLMIDDLHIMVTHAEGTRRIVQDFLESLPPEDQVAIVFVGRSDLSQDFTSDLGAELRTVGRINDALGLAYDATDNGAARNTQRTVISPTNTLDSMLDARNAANEATQRDIHRYALESLDVLENVSASLLHSNYPRKALVYVSEGPTYKIDEEWYQNEWDFSDTPEQVRDFFERMQKAFDDLRHADVPVYTIDPRGIPDCTAVFGMCPSSTVLLPHIVAQQNNLRALAANTGGRAFVSQADLGRAVQEIISDNSAYYLLGYSPQPFTRDGKFHDVKVTVTRPGLHVRSREGYLAPSAAPVTAVTQKQALETAIANVLPVAGLQLRAVATPLGQVGKDMKALVTIEVTYPTPPTGAPREISDQLDARVDAFDLDGRMKSSSARTLRFSGEPGAARDVKFLVNQTITVPSQPLTLRIGIASQALGDVGTVHLPIEAPNASSSDLQLSGVALGFAGQTGESAMGDPLQALVSFQPTTNRTFTAVDTLRVFAHVFGRNAAKAGTAATLTIGGGGPARTMTPPIVRDHGVGTIDAAVSLAGLAPGAHVLELVAKNGNQVAGRQIAFEIR